VSNPLGRASRALCMEKIYGNLRNPTHERRAGAMQLFGAGQRYSTEMYDISRRFVRGAPPT
jgi:hypothetical protein